MCMNEMKSFCDERCGLYERFQGCSLPVRVSQLFEMNKIERLDGKNKNKI